MNKKYKVLVVEDDDLISSMYKIKFENEGFEVTVAGNGAEGLDNAKKGDFDLILLDVILPQLDGFSILSEIKKDKKAKDIPVIMLTNLGTDEDIQKGKNLGAIDYIIKSSFTPSQVSEKIKTYLK